MSLDRRITSAITYCSNTGLFSIEINPDEYAKLRRETIEMLIANNIKIQTNKDIKTMKLNTHKNDCFAYRYEKCLALKNIDCINCKFYRNDIKMQDIENDIIAYTNKIHK